MKIVFVLIAGLIVSLSALSSNSFTLAEGPALSPEEIAAEMEQKFAKRDTFVEKGNSLRYLKVHH